jgi:hypothetical protein
MTLAQFITSALFWTSAGFLMGAWWASRDRR